MQTKLISQQLLGTLGVLGALFFLLSLVFLQFVQPVDWTRHFVSDFVNGPYGLLFTLAVLVHGAGNLALAWGLFRCFESHPLREWASILFGTSAALLFGTAVLGVFVAGIFPTDPFGAPLSPAGLLHEAATAIAFPLELAALFLFSVAYARSTAWRKHARLSFLLSVLATVGLSVFFVTVLIDWMPGLGERLALAGFLLWEVWAAWCLIRKSAAGKADKDGLRLSADKSLTIIPHGYRLRV